MSRFTVVGSGTVVPEGDRGGSAFFLEAGELRVLVDCGPGAVGSLARAGLPWSELTDLVLTHFHGDHVGALPGLFFSLKHGVAPDVSRGALRVWGPAGTRILFERLAEALGEYMLDPGFPVEVRELSPGEPVELDGGAELSVFETPHTPESQAVRLDARDASVGYSGDTGRCPELGDFMRGTDLLVCECSLTDEQVGDNHLSPTSVAEIARRAQPGLLLLTHIYPHVREGHDLPALIAAAGYAGRLELARDGAAWTLPLMER